MYSFGLGHKLGVDVAGEAAGNIPTPIQYNKIYGAGHWNFCTFRSVSIGQGEVNVTPLQVANEMAFIANKGWFKTPHMVDSIEGGDQFSLLSKYSEQHNTSNISDSVFEVVHEAMQGVVDRGTGLGAKVEGIDICGKTGTVENYIGAVKQPNHTFFCGFAPRKNPTIAIMCVVENSGKFGGTFAAPIVGLMIEKYLKDSITNPGRLDQIEKLSTLNLLPARINKEIRRQDSMRRISESSNLISKLSFKKMNDTNLLDEGYERNVVDKFKKESDLNKGRSSKKDSYPFSFKKYIEAVLPNEKRKSVVSVALKN